MKTILLSMLISVSAFATSHGMGNGGDAVVCYTNATRSTIVSVRMFDYWEQEQVLHYPGGVDLGAATLTVKAKIEVATNRIAKFDPNLAEAIKKSAIRLADNLQNYLVTSYILPEIDDMNPKVIPTQPNCYIEQFAVQYKDVITGQRRFAIADKFYNHANTSNDDKAGLLLHESIYRYAILKDPLLNNSDGIRLFNYTIATSKIMNIDATNIWDYVAILNTAGLKDKNCISQIYNHGKEYGYIDKSRSGMPLNGNSAPYKIVMCYTETGNLNSQIQVTTPANWDNTGTSIQHVRIIINGVTYEFDTHGIPTDALSRINIKDIIATPPYATPVFQIKGPLNTFYTCIAGIRLDYKSGNLIDCQIQTQISYNSEVYNVDNLSVATYISDLAIESWKISLVDPRKAQLFNIFGSTKNLKLSVVPHDIYSRPIIVDSLMNVIEGRNTDMSQTISINNRSEQIGYFIIKKVNGVNTLKFSSPFIYQDPKFRNLRLTDSSHYVDTRGEDRAEGIASEFCDLFGRKGMAHAYSFKREYVDYEQFYDILTKKIVFKTDEEVDVIESLKCQDKHFETQVY